MADDRKAKLERIETEGREEIRNAVFDDFPLTPAEKRYKFIGLGLMFFGFAAYFLWFFIVGAALILGVAFILSFVVGVVVMAEGEKKYAKRTKNLRRVRVQLDFSPEAAKRLDEIKEKAGAKSRAETVKNGLRLYEWFLDHKDKDPRVLLTEKGKDGEEDKTAVVELVLDE